MLLYPQHLVSSYIDNNRASLTNSEPCVWSAVPYRDIDLEQVRAHNVVLVNMVIWNGNIGSLQRHERRRPYNKVWAALYTDI